MEEGSKQGRRGAIDARQLMLMMLVLCVMRPCHMGGCRRVWLDECLLGPERGWGDVTSRPHGRCTRVAGDELCP